MPKVSKKTVKSRASPSKSKSKAITKKKPSKQSKGGSAAPKASPAKKGAMKNVGFFGDLFNTKDLIGNIFLEEAITRVSKGRYGNMFLAQNKVVQSASHKGIKDQDLLGVANCDVGIFAFDGIELDSGTVTEFISAKMLDVPAVIYRSDFRGGSGEEASHEMKEGETANKWNLMVSYYPRTKIVYFNGMEEYQKVYRVHKGKSASEIARLYADHVAKMIVDAMDDVCKMPPILNKEENKMKLGMYKKVMGITTVK